MLWPSRTAIICPHTWGTRTQQSSLKLGSRVNTLTWSVLRLFIYFLIAHSMFLKGEEWVSYGTHACTQMNKAASLICFIQHHSNVHPHNLTYCLIKFDLIKLQIILPWSLLSFAPQHLFIDDDYYYFNKEIVFGYKWHQKTPCVKDEYIVTPNPHKNKK